MLQGIRAALVCMIVAFGVLASSARAQQIVVVPAAADVGRLLESGFAEVDETLWADGKISLRAYRIVPGSPATDVTNSVNWVSTDPNAWSFIEPGVLKKGTGDAAYVRVSDGTTLSRRFAVDIAGTFTREHRAARAIARHARMDDPPADRGQIRDGIQGGLNGLNQAGVPTGGMQGALNNVTVVDNASIGNAFGRSWLQDGQEALWVPSGLVANGVTRFMYTSNPLIAIQSSFAQSLAQGNALDANGHPTPAFQTVFHELLHQLIDELKEAGLFELAAAIEEAFAHELASIVMPNIVDAANILRKPTINRQDQVRLRNLITSIKKSLKRLRQDHPNDTGALDEILKKLGWQDEDGNGIPDFLDELLRRRGIPNPDLLPAGPNDPELPIKPLQPAVPSDQAPVNPADD